MTPDQTADQHRFHAQPRWENQPADDWRVSDLDQRQIVATAEEAIRHGRLADPGTRDPAELLRALHLLLPGGRLTHAAVVLFGEDPSRMALYYPQCLLMVARFHGTTKSEFLDNRQFRGHAFEIMRIASKFFLETHPIAGRVLPGMLLERPDEPVYPPEALNYAVAFAICNADYTVSGASVAVGAYDDRLEVTTTGPRYPDPAPEPRPWNPLIADVLHRRGMVEPCGPSIDRMANLVEQAGLPKLEVERAPGSLTVRFKPAGTAPTALEARPRVAAPPTLTP